MRLSSPCAAIALVAATGAFAHAPFVLQAGAMDLAAGPDGNTEIFDTPEGLVVVDTGRHPAHSQAILDHARQVGKPIVAVVNTHWHLDHTTGNRDVFAVYPQARLVATKAMAGALEGFLARSRASAEKQLADPGLPTAERAQTERTLAAIDDRRAMVPAHPVERDQTVKLGGRAFELHVAPAAATEADLWLTVPDEHLVVAGDLVVAPVPFFDTACDQGWRQALDAIGSARWTTLVPGHGAPMMRADFVRWHGAFEAWLGCAESGAPPAQCADGWMRDATGFYTAAEAKGARALAETYVSEVVRAPADKRMAYCKR
jgi:glyoxylase-like metal-dependent hydrolase (beta-lactamase superfamily II)